MQLLIDQKYLIEKTPIDTNVDFSKLTPIIEDVQFLKIKPLLGANLYALILLQSTPPNSLTADNKILLDEYLLPTMRNFVMAHAVIPFRFRYVNAGIVTATKEDYQAIDGIESGKLIDYYKNIAQEYGQTMQNYIRANPTNYPTFFTNTGIDKKKPDQNAFDTDIYLAERPVFDGRERI